MEYITIEKRKLDYILKYADLGLEDANYYYNNIDKIMKDLKIGDILYKRNMTLYQGNKEYFKVEVVKIINKERGEILVQYGDKKSKECVGNLYLTEPMSLYEKYKIKFQDYEDDVEGIFK